MMFATPFTPEHQIFRESLRAFIQKKLYHILINGKKKVPLTAKFGRKWAIWDLWA